MCEQQFQAEVMDEQRQAEIPKQPTPKEFSDFVFYSLRLANEALAKQILGGEK
jgi:hypothetical protein